MFRTKNIPTTFFFKNPSSVGKLSKRSTETKIGLFSEEGEESFRGFRSSPVVFRQTADTLSSHRSPFPTTFQAPPEQEKGSNSRQSFLLLPFNASKINAMTLQTVTVSVVVSYIWLGIMDLFGCRDTNDSGERIVHNNCPTSCQ